MAKYQTKAFTGARPPVLPDDASAEWTCIDIEFPATAPVSGDLIELLDIPIGLRALDWNLVFPDIDSGAAALAWSLGVENVGGTDLGAEVWGTGLTAGQSTAIVRNTTSASAQGDSTVQRRLALKCTTAAGAWAGAGKVGQLLLQLQG